MTQSKPLTVRSSETSSAVPCLFSQCQGPLAAEVTKLLDKQFFRVPSSTGCFSAFLAFSLSLNEGAVSSSLKWFWIGMKMWKMPLQETEGSRQLQVDEEPLKHLLHRPQCGNGRDFYSEMECKIKIASS